MSKVKGAVLFLLGALLALFAYQNWIYPAPPIRFLTFTFPPITHSLIIFSCLFVGFVVGWLVHFRKSRKAEKPAPASSPDSS